MHVSGPGGTLTQFGKEGATMTHGIGRRQMLGMTLVAVFGVSSIALAQQGPGPGGPGLGMMRGGVHGPGMMITDTPTYLASLKAELGITEAQETAWKAYADIVSDTREKMQSVRQSMFYSMQGATWEQRRDLMNSMFQARQDAFDRVHNAAEKLVTELTPEQRRNANKILPGIGFGPGMMGRGGPPTVRR